MVVRPAQPGAPAAPKRSARGRTAGARGSPRGRAPRTPGGRTTPGRGPGSWTVSVSRRTRSFGTASLRDVGERWAGGHLTVAQEHFASAFFETRMSAMARGWDRGTGPRALLACPDGERHTCGLMAFGIALHQHGWRIVFLGPDTPVRTLPGAADQLAADLVVLSATLPEHLLRNAEAIEDLARARPCAVGGAAASDPSIERLGVLRLEGDPVQAAAVVGFG